MHPRSIAVLASAATALSSILIAAPSAVASDKPGPSAEVTSAVAHDTSPPLRELAKSAPSTPESLTDRPVTTNRPVPDDRIDAINAGNPGPPVIPDPTGPGTEDMPALAGSFEGVTNVNAVYPPDTDGDVGPNHYVQMVNISFQIFNKSGTSLLGPAEQQRTVGRLRRRLRDPERRRPDRAVRPVL